MNVDYGKLIKLLRLTESTVDAEALAAIRAANKELKRAGVEWMNIIVIRPEAYAQTAQEIFRGAADSVRAQRFAENLRAKQAERDAAYTNRYDAGNDAWTDYDASYVKLDPMLDAEETALAHCTMIEDEDAKTNWYCFAMREPEPAKFLFDQRDESWIARALFKRICAHGELNDAQLKVLRWRAKRQA